MLKIDRNIPLPTPNTGRKRKYPFFEMKIGDSFLAPAKNFHSLKACAHRFARLNGGKFTFRTMDNGIRCWRIK